MMPIRPPAGLIGMFHSRLADGVAEPKKPSVACRSWARSFCLRRWSASVSRSISRGFFSHSVHPFRAISTPAVASQMMFPPPHPSSLPAGEGRGGREISEGRAVQHSGVDFARDELPIP